MKEVQIKNKVFEEYIDEKAIAQAVKEVAAKINRDYRGKDVIFLGVLNGAFMFASDLLKKIELSCEISFIKVASYSGTTSSGVVHELIGLVTELHNKHVIIVEDIVDTGLTLDKIYSMIDHDEPLSVEVATAFFKPSAYEGSHPPKYRGIEIENEFVVGYGLDYEGYGRNNSSIFKLKQ